MKKIKKTIAFSCILVLMLTLSINLLGCSSSINEREGDDSDTLYVGYVGTSFPSSYMPWQSRDGIAPTISSMVYSTLFSYDEETGNFDPLLAKEWCYLDDEGNPLLLEDGSVDYERLEALYSKSDYIPLKITLHENATWSDGEKVTAEDIYFTFDLCANKNKSNHAGALAWVTGSLEHTYESNILTQQGIFTANHNTKWSGYTFSEDEEDTVIYMHLSRSLGSITTLFTTVLILPEHVYGPVVTESSPINSTKPSEELTYRYTHPIGCGAYSLNIEETNSQVIVLERRDDYHLKDDDGSPYYKVKRIKFILYQEQNVAIFSILKGYIDVLDCSINPNYRSLFSSEKNIQLVEAENNFVSTLVINMNAQKDQMTDMRELLAMKDFRKAIALSINQEELIKNVQDGAASTFSAGLVSSKLTDMYNPESDILSGDYTERIKEANEILDGICPEYDKDGYRLYKGKKVSFTILGSSSEQDLVSYLQVQFKKIGVDVVFGAEGSSPEKTYLYTSKFDMTFQSVTFSSTTVDIMFKSHFVTLGESSNYGRLENSELATMIASMNKTINLNTKNQLIKDIQKVIAEEYYKIPLYSSNILSVARTDRYTGWLTVVGSNTFNTDSLRVLKRVEN